MCVFFYKAGISRGGGRAFFDKKFVLIVLVIFRTIVRIFLLIILLHNYDFEKPNRNQNTN